MTDTGTNLRRWQDKALTAIAILCLSLIAYAWASLQNQVTSLAADQLPRAERLTRLETQMTSIQESIAEIKKSTDYIKERVK